MLIIDNDSRHIKALTHILQPYHPKVVNHCSLTTYSLDPSETIVLSGSHAVPVLWHTAWYRDELELINSHSGLIIGVCLGAELMAHHYGTHLHLLPSLFRGSIQLAPTPHDTQGFFAQRQHVYEAHRWTIPRVISPLIPLATSATGVEAFRHTTKPQYGLQFHPEIHHSKTSVILDIIEHYASTHQQSVA